jgi:hypothetical protein
MLSHSFDDSYPSPDEYSSFSPGSKLEVAEGAKGASGLASRLTSPVAGFCCPYAGVNPGLVLFLWVRETVQEFIVCVAQMTGMP